MILIILCLFIYPSAPSCIRPTLSYRTGQDHCWALYRLDSQRSICFSYSAWKHWLDSAIPGPVCENPENLSTSRWKDYSPRENSTNHYLKRVLKTQIIKTFEQRQSHSDSNSWVYLFVQRIEAIRERTFRILKPYDSFGIMRSLFLDEKRSKAPLEMFRILGFVHLVSATGIHLYTIAAWADFFTKGVCWYFHIPLLLGLRISRGLSFICILILWLISGARMGMLRPWILIMIRKTAEAMGFRWQRASPLCCAIFIDLAISAARTSWGYLGTGYSGAWMYALAVGGGLLWYPYFPSVHLGLAIGSWLLVAVWEAWEAGMINVATPLISLITLPLICLFLYPVLAISIFLNELGLNTIASVLIQILSKGLSFLVLSLCKFSIFINSVWIIPQWAVLGGIFFSTFMIATRPAKFFNLKPGASLILVACLIRLYLCFYLRGDLPANPPSLLSPLPNQKVASKIEQLDVGQGDAAMIWGSQIGLIDTGSIRTLSDQEWMRILSQRTVRKISWVALTHLDDDHASGVLRLAKLVPIGCVAITPGEAKTEKGKKLIRTLNRFGVKTEPWSSRSCIPYPTYSVSRSGRNGNMGAIRVPLLHGGFYLSAGDSSAADELAVGKWARSLAERQSRLPSHRILKVSHHGSSTATSPEFIRLMDPTEAWISSGVGNRYGHPKPEVLRRLMEKGILIRRTDKEGSLSSEHQKQGSEQTDLH